MASLGAGGVIYLTPLVFHQIQLSATQIGQGLATAAFAGTLSRVITGCLLDKGKKSSLIIKWAAFIAIAADLFLLFAQGYKSYALGQILLGAAAGLYWPSVEITIPSNCGQLPSSKGFALARSADAIGTSIGAFLGSLMALLNAIRLIYITDAVCMFIVLFLLYKNKIRSNKVEQLNTNNNAHFSKSKDLIEKKYKWLIELIPIILLSLLATGIFSLLQSALPLDLVIGGTSRPRLSEGWSGIILALQLLLLVIFQWPVGRWLSIHKTSFGLIISISNFCIGCLLLGLSSMWSQGIILVLLAQFPLAFALAAFLPTATESVIQITPINHRGIAMALFSQCFAISALIAPVLAGQVIDRQGNSIQIWVTMSFFCALFLPVPLLIKNRPRNN